MVVTPRHCVEQHQGLFLLQLHFIICHSKKCHRPRSSSRCNHSEVEQDTDCIPHGIRSNGNTCLDMWSGS